MATSDLGTWTSEAQLPQPHPQKPTAPRQNHRKRGIVLCLGGETDVRKKNFLWYQPVIVILLVTQSYTYPCTVHARTETASCPLTCKPGLGPGRQTQLSATLPAFVQAVDLSGFDPNRRSRREDQSLRRNGYEHRPRYPGKKIIYFSKCCFFRVTYCALNDVTLF